MSWLEENPHIKAVIFDLDGTLLDSMHIWQDIDREYLGRYGVAFDPALSEEIKNMSFNESAKYFKSRFLLPKSEEEIKADWNEMAKEHYRNKILLKDGAEAFLKELQEKGIKMAIATSCVKEHAHMALKRLGIESYFSTIQFCLDIGKNKEHPDIFCKCAEVLEEETSSCAVIEDLYVALQVAKEAGFHTIGVNDVLSLEQEQITRDLCDYYIHSFQELL